MFAQQNSVNPSRDEEEVRGSRLGDLDSLAPLLAGARARGVADAFELLGTPAILIDQFGAVLHVGASATKLLGADIAVVSRHLVGGSASANRALQELIASAVSGEDEVAASPVLLAREGRSPLTIRAIRIPGAAGDPMQLLKAVIVLGESEAPVCSANSSRALSVAA